MQSIQQIITKGLKWSVSVQSLTQILKIGRWIILLYYLTPADFGLFSMGVLLIGLPQMFLDEGLTSAVIQNKKSFSIAELSTYHWLLVGYSALLCGLYVFFSTQIVAFFNEPDLGYLIIFLSVAYLIESFGKIPHCLLQKSLKFEFLAKTEAIVFIISSILTLVFAYMGLGLWALAYGLLVTYILLTVSYSIKARFLPQLTFSLSHLRELHKYVINLTLFRIMSYFMRFLDDFIIGFFFGKTALGIYDRAYQIVHLPMRLITNKINYVLFPVYSAPESKKTEIRQVHLKIIHYAAAIYFPVLAIIILFSKDSVALFLPEKWSDLTYFMPILAAGGVLHAFLNFNQSIFLSQNRTDLQLKYGFLTRGIIIFSYLVGVYFGVKGIAIGYTIGSLLAFFPESIRAWKIIDLSLPDFWKTIQSSLLFSILLVVGVLGLFSFLEGEIYRLVFGGLFCVLCLAVWYWKLFFVGKNVLKSGGLN